MRHVKHTVVACVIAAFAAGNSGAADYETQFNKPAKDAVPPTVAAGPDFKVNDPVEANFFVNMAQILRGYHETQGPITGIAMVGALTVAQTKAGPAMIQFALDYGVWTANADRLSQNIKTTYTVPGFNGNFQFWVTGSLSPKGKREMEARGFAVVEQVGSRFEIID